MITPPFIRPPDVQGSDPANDTAFWNSLFTPLYDFVGSIANRTQNVITGNHTVTTESHLFVDCSGGNITITLPSTGAQAIVITKIDGTFNEVILTSSSFIERFGDYTVSPSHNTAKIVVPKQSVTYLLNANRWRIVDSYMPTVESHVRLNTTMVNLPTGNDNHILFAQKTFDPFNLYTLATSQFTLPVSGVYSVSTKINTDVLTATNVNNGVLVESVVRVFNGNSQVLSEQIDSAVATNGVGVRSSNGQATVASVKGNTVRVTVKAFGAAQPVLSVHLLSRASITLLSYEH